MGGDLSLGIFLVGLFMLCILVEDDSHACTIVSFPDSHVLLGGRLYGGFPKKKITHTFLFKYLC